MIALLALQIPGNAADLSKIDRTIGKEPAYQSKPKYCLVVFGPEAKTRLWVVFDGSTIYGSDKKGEISKLTLRSGSGYYLPFPGTSRVLVVQAPDKDKGVGEMRMEYLLDSNAAKKQTIEGTVRLGDDPKTAPVIHFDGSYTSTLRERGLIENGKWVRDRNEVESVFHVFIGSNVLQKEGAAFVRTWWCHLSEQLRPVAEMEFPHQDPKEAPIKLRVPLVFR
jgi:hypothetical protein